MSGQRSHLSTEPLSSDDLGSPAASSSARRLTFAGTKKKRPSSRNPPTRQSKRSSSFEEEQGKSLLRRFAKQRKRKESESVGESRQPAIEHGLGADSQSDFGYSDSEEFEVRLSVHGTGVGASPRNFKLSASPRPSAELSPSGSAYSFDITNTSLSSINSGILTDPKWNESGQWIASSLPPDPNEEPQRWIDSVPKAVSAPLSKADVKRQECIYELIQTERGFFRSLQILDKLFRQTLQRSCRLSDEEMFCLFANLDEVLCHSGPVCRKFWDILENHRGGLLPDMGAVAFGIFPALDATPYAVFCANQKAAVELYNKKMKEDSHFAHVIKTVQSRPECSRLSFADFVAKVMQRLARYPLLLKAVLKAGKKTGAHPEDCKKLQIAIERSEAMLKLVNDHIKARSDRERMAYIQKHLDFSACAHEHLRQYKLVNITADPRRTLIREGSMILMPDRDTEKPKDVYIILLSDVLLFTVQRDEGWLLKCPGKGRDRRARSPVLLLSKTHISKDAGRRRGFILIDLGTSPSMYNLRPPSNQASAWYSAIETHIDKAKKAAESGRSLRLFDKESESAKEDQAKHMDTGGDDDGDRAKSPLSSTKRPHASSPRSEGRQFGSMESLRDAGGRNDAIRVKLMSVHRKGQSEPILLSPRSYNEESKPSTALPDLATTVEQNIMAAVDSEEGNEAADEMEPMETKTEETGEDSVDTSNKQELEAHQFDLTEHVATRLGDTSQASNLSTGSPNVELADSDEGAIHDYDRAPRSGARRRSSQESHRPRSGMPDQAIDRQALEEARQKARRASASYELAFSLDSDGVLASQAGPLAESDAEELDLGKDISFDEATGLLATENTFGKDRQGSFRRAMAHSPTTAPAASKTPSQSGDDAPEEHASNTAQVESKGQTNARELNKDAAVPSQVWTSQNGRPASSPTSGLNRPASQGLKLNLRQYAIDAEPVAALVTPPSSPMRRCLSDTDVDRLRSGEHSKAAAEATGQESSEEDVSEGSHNHADDKYNHDDGEDEDVYDVSDVSDERSEPSDVDDDDDDLDDLAGFDDDDDDDEDWQGVSEPEDGDDGDVESDGDLLSSFPESDGLLTSPGYPDASGSFATHLIELETPALVIELGGSVVRAGYAGEDLPRMEVPAMLARLVGEWDEAHAAKPPRGSLSPTQNIHLADGSSSSSDDEDLSSTAASASQGHMQQQQQLVVGVDSDAMPQVGLASNTHTSNHRTSANSSPHASRDASPDAGLSYSPSSPRVVPLFKLESQLDVLDYCRDEEFCGVAGFLFPTRAPGDANSYPDMKHLMVLLGDIIQEMAPETGVFNMLIVDRYKNTLDALLQQRLQLASALFHQQPRLNGVQFAAQTFCASLATKRTPALIVHVGETATCILPVVPRSDRPGFVEPLCKYAHRSVLGGLYVTKQLRNLLKPQAEAFRAVTGERYGGEKTMCVLQDIREEACYVALDTLAELENATLHRYDMSDGGVVELRTERFKCAEPLFSGRPVSRKGRPRPLPLPQLIRQCISACPEELHHELWHNIVLTGGATCMRNFTERLRLELAMLEPTRRVTVHSPDVRELLPFRGASMLAAQAASVPVYGQGFVQRRKHFAIEDSLRRDESILTEIPFNVGMFTQVELSKLRDKHEEFHQYNRLIADLKAEKNRIRSQLHVSLGSRSSPTPQHRSSDAPASSGSESAPRKVLTTCDADAGESPRPDDHDGGNGSHSSSDPASSPQDQSSAISASAGRVSAAGKERAPSTCKPTTSQEQSVFVAKNGQRSPLRTDVERWTTSQVAEWLTLIELPELAAIFKANGIAGHDLVDMTDADLRSMRIHDPDVRLQVLKEISILLGELRQPAASATSKRHVRLSSGDLLLNGPDSTV